MCPLTHKLRLNLNNNSTKLICRDQLQFSKRFSKVLYLQATCEGDKATQTPICRGRGASELTCGVTGLLHSRYSFPPVRPSRELTSSAHILSLVSQHTADTATPSPFYSGGCVCGPARPGNTGFGQATREQFCSVLNSVLTAPLISRTHILPEAQSVNGGSTEGGT